MELDIRKAVFIVPFGYEVNEELTKPDYCLHGGEQNSTLNIKRPAHLSIVERLGGFWWCKGTSIFWNYQFFSIFLNILVSGSSLKMIRKYCPQFVPSICPKSIQNLSSAQFYTIGESKKIQSKQT